ncbi:MAG: sigma-54 dependent transcriptional regulator [Thermonemataceae bacterium]|nr:sigma-54 dependent transcriptional regulator [Thermonemataceae bacterium]
MRVLIVDDDEDILLAAKMFLKKHAKEVVMESNPKKIPFLLNQSKYDVILLDMNFTEDTTSGKEGFYWLEQILQQEPKAVVVMITAFGDIEMAVKALKIGATDFVLKPWQNEKLLATILSAAKLNASYKEVENLQKNKQALAEVSSSGEIIGESKAIKKLLAMIDKVAHTEANVLILGENGTGKELVAKAIHKKSKRFSENFVSVDMGAISETLFESELFGHKKGAFTDAKEDRMGRFELAHKGTLFLDEIGNLALTHQAKLLAALQNRSITPLGTNKNISIDIRLISATNLDIHQAVGNGDFRQDLLYRINTIELHLPPLRERIGDIAILAQYFLEKYAKKYHLQNPKLSASALEFLEKYPFPGNVRELEHALERAMIMSEGSLLEADDFQFLTSQKTPKIQLQLEQNKLQLDEVEKDLIQKVLDKHNGNISKAAKELGLTRASLYRRLEKYDL